MNPRRSRRSFHKHVLAEAKARGWRIEKVEHQLGPRKKDLFCGDYIALDGWPGSRLIQVTSSGNHAARKKKIAESEDVYVWLSMGNRFTIWSYRKDLSLREEEVRIEDASP